jgi:hypothetical protein
VTPENLTRAHRNTIADALADLGAYRIADDSRPEAWRAKAALHDRVTDTYRKVAAELARGVMVRVLADAETGQREAAAQCRRIADHAEQAKAGEQQ